MNARFDKGNFQRDLVIVCKVGNGAQNLIEFLVDEKRNLQLKAHASLEYSKDSEAYVIAYFHQQNIDAARKQFQPLIEEFLQPSKK
jgi:hypothetical protein